MRNRHGRGVYAAVWRNTKDGYERLYADSELLEEYETPDRAAFHAAVATICAGFQPASVVDVGCGAGHLLAQIDERMSGRAELVGVDHAVSGIERLRQRLPGAEGIVADIGQLDLGDRRFDLVVCTEVLEHLDEPAVAVSALGRLRAVDGVVVVTVPDGAHDTWEGHVNFWTDAELAALLAPIGGVEVDRIGPTDDLLAIVR